MAEVRPDLVGSLGDARSDGGGDPLRRGAQRDHGGDGCFQNTRHGTPPARMSGADDACARISETEPGRNRP